jgi:hypothetical protein
MMNRTEWQAVRDAMIADDRARLGPPPTAEELLAYERGELSAEEAERVRQLLLAYPELARAYAAPFPEDDAALPSDVVDRQWQRFRAGKDVESGGRVLQFWRAVSAIAAAVAVIFGAMLWQKESESRRPHALPEAQVLSPDGSRGVEPPHLAITPSGESVVLTVSVIGTNDYERYRIELVRGDSQKPVWTSEPLRLPKSGSAFDLEIPSATLAPGTYQIVVEGLRGTAREPVATYSVDVMRRADR